MIAAAKTNPYPLLLLGDAPMSEDGSVMSDDTKDPRLRTDRQMQLEILDRFAKAQEKAAEAQISSASEIARLVAASQEQHGRTLSVLTSIELSLKDLKGGVELTHQDNLDQYQAMTRSVEKSLASVEATVRGLDTRIDDMRKSLDNATNADKSLEESRQETVRQRWTKAAKIAAVVATIVSSLTAGGYFVSCQGKPPPAKEAKQP